MQPAAQLQAFLRAGERLVWSGRPDPAKHFTAIDLFIVPFSLFWTGLPMSSAVASVADREPLTSVLPLLPFLVVGSYLTVGRFAWKAYRKRRTTYGVTDQRVIVSVGTRSVADAPLADLPVSIHWSLRRRHVSVVFGTPSGWFGGSGGAAYGNTGMEFGLANRPLAFYDVAEPDALLAALGRPDRRSARRGMTA